jgi:hypothetical protein
VRAILISAIALGLLAAGCSGGQATTTSVLTRGETITRTVTASSSAQPVYVAAYGGKLVQRPTLIGVGASNEIKNIRWRRYGGPVAVGRGTESNPACTASCPPGQPVWLPTTVRLRAVVLCHGVAAYSEMTSSAIAGVIPLDCPPKP